MSIEIFVPADPHCGIDPGSGVVGQPKNGHVLVDFEGNRYGAVNIITFADRVHHAWERQSQHYPTTARRLLDCGQLRHIGHYDPERGRVLLSEPAAEQILAAWLGSKTLDSAELQTAGVLSPARARTECPQLVLLDL